MLKCQTYYADCAAAEPSRSATRSASQAKLIPRQAYGAAYGHMACQATVLLEPNTTQELANALAEQLKLAAGKSVKVRATHK